MTVGKDAPNIIMLVGESHGPGPDGCVRQSQKILHGYIGVNGDVRWFDVTCAAQSELHTREGWGGD